MKPVRIQTKYSKMTVKTLIVIYKQLHLAAQCNTIDRYHRCFDLILVVLWSRCLFESACLVVKPITVYSYGSSLIARQWIRPQIQ